MLKSSRFTSFISLVGILFIAAALASLVEQNQAPLFLLLFLIGLLGWIIWMGGGWRAVDKDTAIVVEDVTRTTQVIDQGSYLYIPIVNTIAAKMPTYPIAHKFEVDAIDTRTPKLLKIQKITVSVNYKITDFMVCYEKSADIKQRIKDLEQLEKLKTDNPTLWIRALSATMEGLVARSIRTAVWNWAMLLAEDSDLKLETPFERSSPVEHDPYALSLNRHKLSEFVKDEVCRRAQEWGLVVRSLSFANIDLAQEIIDKATRDKPGEIEGARHDALKEAVAIREKGLAEAEVRAATVAKVIEVLMNQERLPLTEQVLYNIVRAAMYSDGQMIWNATMEKTSGSSVKVA